MTSFDENLKDLSFDELENKFYNNHNKLKKLKKKQIHYLMN